MKKILKSRKYPIIKMPAFLLLYIITIVLGALSLFALPNYQISPLFGKTDINNLIQNVFTILLAASVGCFIGWEREKRNRPAGLRTYALVCVGSAIVMVTSFELIHVYNAYTSIDPTRLGAQVISGIGFLGAGTIIRDRFSVKGLTTAASLWTVACIGLMIGSRMYTLSIIVTSVIYYLLHKIHSVEEIKSKKLNYKITISIKYETNQLEEIQKLMKSYGNLTIEISSISSSTVNEILNTDIILNLTSFENDNTISINNMVMDLYTIKNVISVKVER